MVRRLPLRSNYGPREALVDDGDYEVLAGSVWRYYDSGWTGYAVLVANPAVKMHRIIAAAPPGMPVHHENGDGLDNRRANLIVLSLSEHRRRHGQRHPHPPTERPVPQLRALREARAFSQRALAATSGVAAGTILRLEQGQRGAYPTTVRKLAQALGVTPRALYE